MSEYTTFTSESVSEGHPDKLADQISDAVLDAILKDDPNGRVAVETMVKTGMAIIAGEVTTSTYVDLEDVVRKVILDIGYDSSDVGFDGETFHFTGLNVPKAGQLPFEDQLALRLESVQEFEALLESMFATFLELRMDGNLWKKELKAIQSWVEDK